MLFYNFDLENQTRKRIQSSTKVISTQKNADCFKKSSSKKRSFSKPIEKS
ncbi:MAG: hypothetical protein WC860_02835 [Candidatus Margulisiibacteriota bacterium]|jgi:hypothetical protein